MFCMKPSLSINATHKLSDGSTHQWHHNHSQLLFSTNKHRMTLLIPSRAVWWLPTIDVWHTKIVHHHHIQFPLELSSFFPVWCSCLSVHSPPTQISCLFSLPKALEWCHHACLSSQTPGRLAISDRIKMLQLARRMPISKSNWHAFGHPQPQSQSKRIVWLSINGYSMYTLNWLGVGGRDRINP